MRFIRKMDSYKVLIICACFFLAACKADEEWEAFRKEHNCHVISFRGMEIIGKMIVPARYTWECDNGTYENTFPE